MTIDEEGHFAELTDEKVLALGRVFLADRGSGGDELELDALADRQLDAEAELHGIRAAQADGAILGGDQELPPG